MKVGGSTLFSLTHSYLSTRGQSWEVEEAKPVKGHHFTEISLQLIFGLDHFHIEVSTLAATTGEKTDTKLV